jgi:dTMP kinase
MNKGTFFSIEGVDCSGKTTNLNAITSMLRDLDIPHHQTREPGGTPFAEDLRGFIFEATSKYAYIPQLAEALLFYSARIDHCVNKIIPLLRLGSVVLTDRFYDSTFAYQSAGSADTTDLYRLMALHDVVAEAGFIPKPTKTLLYDIPIDTYIERKAARGMVVGEEVNGLEERSMQYFTKVRDTLLDRASREPDRFIVIDANRPVEEVIKTSIDIVRDILHIR